MRTFLTIAWRNIWRNKRRTIITTAAIVFSIGVTVLSFALNDGSHDDMIRNAIRVFTGYIQIQPEGYKDDPAIERSFVLEPGLLETLRTTPGISGFSPRLQTGALAATSENSMGALLVGIIPENEKTVTNLSTKIIKGEFLRDNGEEVREAVIGDDMAKNLSLDIGSDVALVTQGVDGSMGAFKYRVTGIFDSGSNEMDRSLVLIHLRDAQELVQGYDMINMVALMIDNPNKTEEIISRLQGKIQTAGDRKLVILGWRELLPELVQVITLDNASGYLFLTPLLIIVVFGILSTLISSVLERTHEFGIMLALGTRPGQIVLLVLFESLFLTIIGLLLGLIVGLGFAVYFSHYPIQLPQSYEEITREYGVSNEVRAAIYPVKVIITSLSIMFLSMLFALYPAWKASSLKPDRAIRDIIS